MADAVMDSEIFSRLKAGDMSACRMCVEEHSDELYRLAYRMVRDEQAAEDIVQDTFLNAFKGLERFDGRSTLGTWLFRIAYNNALMKLRAQKPIASLDEDAEFVENAPAPIVVPWRETPEEIVEQREMSEQLDSAIAALPTTLRAVFQLRDIEERSTAETAEILGLSEAAVKVRLHRARLALRETLSGYFGETQDPYPATMTCEELMPYLSDYIDRAIDEPLAEAARHHIATCQHCHVLLNTTQMSITLLQKNKTRTIPVADRAALFEKIQAAFDARTS
jgi:RNA polymerase sigma-70 factor (ECF subfamily)